LPLPGGGSIFRVHDIQPLLVLSTPPILQHYRGYHVHVALQMQTAQGAAEISESRPKLSKHVGDFVDHGPI
jgi:hypothetical protein